MKEFLKTEIRIGENMDNVYHPAAEPDVLVPEEFVRLQRRVLHKVALGSIDTRSEFNDVVDLIYSGQLDRKLSTPRLTLEHIVTEQVENTMEDIDAYRDSGITSEMKHSLPGETIHLLPTMYATDLLSALARSGFFINKGIGEDLTRYHHEYKPIFAEAVITDRGLTYGICAEDITIGKIDKSE